MDDYDFLESLEQYEQDERELKEENATLRAEVERLKKEAVISVELVALSNSHVRVVWDLVLDLGKEVNALRAKLAKAEEALNGVQRRIDEHVAYCSARGSVWEGNDGERRWVVWVVNLEDFDVERVRLALAAIREEKP